MKQRNLDIKIKGNLYKTPIFLPDATLGVVKGVSSKAVQRAGTRGAVVNTYHLMSTPGIELLEKTDGIKGFMNFDGLIISDSGGWQVFSLIHRNGSPGKITDEGVTFSIGGGKNELFTPEKSIQVQFAIGSDVIICLDDFTSPTASKEEIEDSIRRTTLWAKRCKEEYNRQIKEKKLTDETKPLIFAVIQGHLDKDLRTQSAKELIEIGFDGYGYGGYVVDEKTQQLDLDISQFVADLIPDDKIKFALGMGKPWDIAALYEMGWDIFDCTLPTRDARHQRLYTIKKEPASLEDLKNKDNYEFIYIKSGKYADDLSPISNLCECSTCKNYSRSYVRHLFRVKDMLAYRLATIHNLHFYNWVVTRMAEFS